QNSPWLANGWIVETAGEVTHLSQPALDEQQG
ncbi:phosphoglycerate mutase, partial [Escherichia coli]|nr:phosphoglycerate mutase [Escherichia coli]